MKHWLCIFVLVICLLPRIAYATDVPSEIPPMSGDTNQEVTQESDLLPDLPHEPVQDPDLNAPLEPVLPETLPESPNLTDELLLAELISINESMQIIVYFFFPFSCAFFIVWQLGKWFFRSFVNDA